MVSFKQAWTIGQNGYLREPTAYKSVLNAVISTPNAPVSQEFIQKAIQTPNSPSNAFWEKVKFFFWICFASNRKAFVDSISKTNSFASQLIGEMKGIKMKQESLKTYKIQWEVCNAAAPKESLRTWISPWAHAAFQKAVQERAQANQEQLEQLGKKLATQGFNVAQINIDDEMNRLEQELKTTKAKLEFLSQQVFTQPRGVGETIRAELSEKPQKPAKESMLEDISTRVHTDLGNLFGLLFNKFEGALAKQDLIKTWNCDKDGNFTLTLNQPLRMWVPSTNERGEEDPVGGVVLMLGEGDDHLEVRGKLTKKDKDQEGGTMTFDDGFYCYVKYSIAGYNKMFQPNIFTLDYNSKDDVKFGAGIYFFGKRERQRSKTIENLRTNWTQNGEVFVGPQDSEALTAKINAKIEARAQGL